MSKTKVSTPDYGKVALGFVEKVKAVIAKGDKHSYSTSEVYTVYNAAYGKSETPQTCSSCLRNRVEALRKWLKGYEAFKASTDKDKGGKIEKTKESGKIEDIDPQYDNPDAPGYVSQAGGTVRYPMAEGIPFDFLPNEGTIVKGVVTRADGSTVKPGTYITAEGLGIVVQPGGKANIKDENDLL